MRSKLPVLILALTTTSCDLLSSEARGISVRLDANPQVAQLGDTVYFTVSVVATQVSGVVMDFGDSHTDQASAGGLPSALVEFKHAYTATGTFMSRATVTDAAVGDRVVTQQIVVNPRTNPPLTRR